VGGWLFDEDESTKKRGSSRQFSMHTLFKMGCKACPLDRVKDLRHPKMDATGSKKPLAYILGEGPGVEEDKLNEQFIGKSGHLLREYIPEELLEIARLNNTINCHKDKNVTPTSIEITCCRPRLISDIEKTKPKVIFGFGGIPLKWAIGEERITSWRGLRIPIQVGNHCCWYYPFYHPSYLSRMRRRHPKTRREIPSEQERTFDRDIQRAINELESLPKATIISEDEIKSNIKIITGERGWKDVKLIKKKLDQYAKLSKVAFDYETASDEKPAIVEKQVRPYGQNARILTIAVGTKKDTIAFPIKHREAEWTKSQFEEVWQAWISFLRSDTEKIAHHLFFELEWTIEFFGKDLARCCTWHDTMAQAYVLGRQRGTTNLDALILTNFGFRLKDVVPVNLSNLDNEPLPKVLLYNALDAKWEHALFVVQQKVIEYKKLLDVYREQVRHVPTVALKSHFGMLIDFDALLGFDEKYSPKIVKLETWFQNSSAASKFEKRMGRRFKPSSPQDVLLMLKNVLGRKECKVGEDEKGKAKYSTEDAVLEKIPLKIAKKIREYRAVRGNKSKYVDPLLPKDHAPKVVITKKKATGLCIWPDGMTHAALQTQFLVTRRTSCSFPNEQFWPKRDEGYSDLRRLFISPTRAIRERIKSGFDYNLPSHVTEDDCWFVAIDYGQIQARIAGMLSHDKMYCTYLWDRNDIHMRWTKKLARAYPRRIGGEKFLKDKDALKKFRTDVKNQWTFPLIFGATAKSVSEYLHIPVEDLKPLIRQFFREMPGLSSYQKRMRNFYDDNGYVEGPTGWRRHGPLDHGEIINTPIQNAEVEIVLHAMDRLSEAAQELEEWQFQARLMVHDELGFWIPKKTIDRDLEFIAYEMLQCEHFPWITVPLCLEIGKGPNWFDQEEVSTIYSDDLGLLNRKECGF
jgi:uracil-DNA glycosylase family 4